MKLYRVTGRGKKTYKDRDYESYVIRLPSHLNHLWSGAFITITNQGTDTLVIQRVHRVMRREHKEVERGENTLVI